MVKHKLTFEFIQLDILAIEFGGNVGLPVFGDFGKLFGDVDLGHVEPRRLVAVVFSVDARHTWRLQENWLTAEKVAELCSAGQPGAAVPTQTNSRQLLTDG